ncbi:uncharacterized protein LOC143357742 isoform X2 [Halictus rubicundus]|uniref:uncharacterized protein LOC143357742 isoform X2 n=1 Tax=Halictus rubicundus TaxID=77578 RepID=UPI00403523D7
MRKNMDEESSFCSSCKSMLQYSSSIGEPSISNEELYQLTEKDNIERSIENYEIGLNIIDTTYGKIDHVKPYAHKKVKSDEDFVEKLMFYTNKKIKPIDVLNKSNLAPYDTYKNITHKINTYVESGNNDFSNKIYPAKIPHAQDVKQKNNCETVKERNSIRDERKNAEMINNGSQSIAQNILDYRKNILGIARSVLELSNYIDNMRKLILHEIDKRQSGVIPNNKKKVVKLDLLGKDFPKL